MDGRRARSPRPRDAGGAGARSGGPARPRGPQAAARRGAPENPDTGRRRGERTPPEPALPEDVDLTLLHRDIRAELRSLSKPNADAVAGHLVVAGQALDAEDAPRALAHARAARQRAARVGSVREAAGIAAYHAGEWAEAIAELRAARRITGDPRHLAVLADCERALGRPAQALRLLDDPDVRRLDPEARAELLIVIAGARRDLDQAEAALAVLARGGLDRQHPRPGAMRLWYAYADALESLGRREEAAQWFAASAALDVEGELDAAERAAGLV